MRTSNKRPCTTGSTSRFAASAHTQPPHLWLYDVTVSFRNLGPSDSSIDVPIFRTFAQENKIR